MSLSAQQKPEIGFVCGPCGCSEDTTFHKEPGACSACGMERFAAIKDGYEPVYKRINNAVRKTVAILLFPGVQIIDYTGPYEVFGQAGWEVFTVAQNDTLIRTSMGMLVQPHYTFEDVPEFDFLLLPGGNVTPQLQNETVMNWLKKQVPENEQTLSVCNGAYFLGAGGFLDGQTATTFASLIGGLRDLAPEANIVEDQRFTDNGKILTSAGLSSGIDAAIYLVSKYQGIGNARRLATNLEYDWNPDHGYVRAALADRHFASWGFIYPYDRELLKYEGDRNHWIVELNVTTNQSTEDLMRVFAYQAEKGSGWKRLKGYNWSFEADGDPWKATVEITEKGKTKALRFAVRRSES